MNNEAIALIGLFSLLTVSIIVMGIVVIADIRNQ